MSEKPRPRLWPSGKDQWQQFAQQVEQERHTATCTNPRCCLDDDATDDRPDVDRTWPLLEPISPEQEETLF